MLRRSKRRERRRNKRRNKSRTKPHARVACPRRLTAVSAGVGVYWAMLEGPAEVSARQVTASALQLKEWQLLRKKKKAEEEAQIAARASGGESSQQASLLQIEAVL